MKLSLAVASLALVAVGCRILPPPYVFVQRFAERHPNNPHALFMEGNSYLRQGQPGRAASRFRDALRLQPDFEEAQVGLAHALREAGSYRAAARVYGEVLARSSQNVQALEGLAICQWRLGRTEEAEQLLRKALEVQPVRKEAAVSLSHTMGDLLYSQRRYGEALDYWEKSLELDPTQSSLRTLVEDLRQYVARYGPSPR